jgi:hypothetical protein
MHIHLLLFFKNMFYWYSRLNIYVIFDQHWFIPMILLKKLRTMSDTVITAFNFFEKIKQQLIKPLVLYQFFHENCWFFEVCLK